MRGCPTCQPNGDYHGCPVHDTPAIEGWSSWSWSMPAPGELNRHQLLRLDIYGRPGGKHPRGRARELRLAHCACGATAEIRPGEGHLWITLHRRYPLLYPAQLATLFGIS